MIRRIRIRAIEEQTFPYYLTPKLLSKYFSFVSKDYEYTFLPLIKEEDQDNFQMVNWEQYLDGNSRTAVIHTLDEYWNRTKFNQAMIQVCENCDLVFGHQLPANKPMSQFSPIFFRSLLQPTHDPSNTQNSSMTHDICFWGAFEPQNDAKSFAHQRLRERSYRTFVIEQIAKHKIKHSWNINIKSVYYWRLTKHERDEITKQYAMALQGSKLGLSLYGYGYNSYRNADIFALGCTLLSPMIYNHVLLPEFEKWYSHELGFFFHDDCSDLENVIQFALGNDTERRRRAYNGHAYFKKYSTYRGIVESIHTKLLSKLE